MVEQLRAEARTPVAFQAAVEYQPRPALEAQQQRLLAQAVKRAQGAPFFRERVKALGEVGDDLPFARFQECVPLTTKQELREAGTRAWVEYVRPRIALLLATSGTTGTRIALPYTADDLQRWQELAARTLWTNGLRPDDVVLLPPPLGLFTGGHGMFGGLSRLGCTVIPLGPLPSPAVADALRGGFGATPTAIVSLPSHMLRLLDSLPAIGYDPADSPLQLGSFGAEAWSEAARRRIEDGFHLRAVDSYGIGELCGPGVAAECEFRCGMHVWEDAFFVEILDPESGEPTPDGTAGELVLTSLFREVLPLLRFRTGDEACLLAGECPCGRTHRRISRIGRRLDDILVVTGVNIDPGDIERILYGIPWLGNEFYLEAGGAHGDTLVIHVERKAGEALPEGAEARVAARVREEFHARVTAVVHEAGEIERLPGKAKRIRG